MTHTRAKPRAAGRPSVSVRPLPEPDQVGIRTACTHGTCRVGFQLGPSVTERVAVCTALMHHHLEYGCGCMRMLYPRYKTAAAPADLDGVRDRFEAIWADVEDQQRR